MNNKPFSIGGIVVEPGERKLLQLSNTTLYAQIPIAIPVHVIHGKKQGPRIFIVAVAHGDEINGMEIINRLLVSSHLKNIRGTIIAVPVMNVHGLINLSRYLPDRRDLNRSFPGSKSGSLAARIAYFFTNEIISQCTHGIDLHTGHIHSENLPHVRTNLDIPGALFLAKMFNTPIIIDAKIRDGSLRQAAAEFNIPVLVYEGGEALRFNELAIRMGLRGILNVLKSLKMIKSTKINKKIKSKIAYYSSWVRSPESGIVRPLTYLGADVEEGEKIGVIENPFEKKEKEVLSHTKGIVIGKNRLPLVNEGDALFHIAKLKSNGNVSSEINQLQIEISNDPFADF